jgi:hypothetical protein
MRSAIWDVGGVGGRRGHLDISGGGSSVAGRHLSSTSEPK